eukprot:80375_1
MYNPVDLERRIKMKQSLSTKIRIYCIVDIALGSMFTIWALYNTIDRNSPDGGDLTFPFSIIAALFGLLSVHYYHQENDKRARIFGTIHLYTIVISHIFLTVNYTVGAIVEENVLGANMFFTVMGIFYVCTAVIYGYWAYQFKSLFLKQQDSYIQWNDNMDEL